MSTEGIGPYVRQLRLRRGLTQKDLGDAVGTSAARIAQIEGGRVALPGADVRRNLAATLGVRHVDLLIAAGELNADEVAPSYEPTDPRVQEFIDLLPYIDEVVMGALRRMTGQHEPAKRRAVNG